MLIKQLGYGFDLSTNGTKSNHSNLIKIDGVNYKLPNFLVQDMIIKKLLTQILGLGLL